MTIISGIEPHLAPGLCRRFAAEFDTCGVDAPTAPPLRARHVADHVFGGDQRDRLLEGEAALQRLRLLAGPGADLCLLRARGEIGVGFLWGHRRHVAADADLTAQRLPVK